MRRASQARNKPPDGRNMRRRSKLNAGAHSFDLLFGTFALAKALIAMSHWWLDRV
jgi:hypothetical protein